MKAVIQRVSSASVHSEGKLLGSINAGLLVLLGVAEGDTEAELDWLCQKITKLRIMADADGKMNLSILETDGEMLLISQFTLLANAIKGNRPSYIKAAAPEAAIPLYEKAISSFQQLLGKNIETGSFGANMQVQLINDGPVTIVLDTAER